MYVLYFIMWIIFAGDITLEICIFGAVIAAVIFAFTCKFQTIRLILSEKEEVKPVLVDFQTDRTSETGKVLLANSITLTPGTITVELEDSGYVVHCLDESLAGGIDESVFVELIRKLEKE